MVSARRVRSDPSALRRYGHRRSARVRLLHVDRDRRACGSDAADKSVESGVSVKKNSDAEFRMPRTQSDTMLLIRVARTIQRILRALILRRRFRNVARLNLRRFSVREPERTRQTENTQPTATAYNCISGPRRIPKRPQSPYLGDCYDELRYFNPEL